MSISILISYILLGLTLAAPIGPVNSARLDKGIKNGFWHAWFVGAGSMVADAVFMLLVYLGMVQFLSIPIVQIFLWLFGGFIHIYTGTESIFKANSITLSLSRKKESYFQVLFNRFYHVYHQSIIYLILAWNLRISFGQNSTSKWKRQTINL